jgi:mRNA interferase MazF
METIFLGFQIRSLDPGRFSGQPAGRLSSEKMAEVENAVRRVLGL